MKLFKNLSLSEIDALLKFPAYISLLAANGDGKLDEAEKKSAIEFSHTKTFSSGPLLREYFDEADKVFENNMEQLDNALPKDKEGREAAIRVELMKIDAILLKSGKRYTTAMRLSMESIKEHVSRAHHNVLVDFVLPVSISGLTEK